APRCLRHSGSGTTRLAEAGDGVPDRLDDKAIHGGGDSDPRTTRQTVTRRLDWPPSSRLPGPREIDHDRAVTDPHIGSVRICDGARPDFPAGPGGADSYTVG